MIWTNNIPATKIDINYVWGEVKELVEEINKWDMEGFISELCDVYTCSMCAIETHLGIVMPVFWMKSVNVWMNRVRFFENYLKEFGLVFKVEYMRNGGNYKKKEKRMKVLELAIKDQLK